MFSSSLGQRGAGPNGMAEGGLGEHCYQTVESLHPVTSYVISNLFCYLPFNTDHLPEVNLSYNDHFSNDFGKDSRHQLFNFIASATKA